MIPILFEAGSIDFSTHGIGDLSDVTACDVTMYGLQYELYMEYPADGKRAAELTERRVIFAKPCQTDREQPFIIYRAQKSENNVIRVYARHVYYDLAGIPIAPFTASSAADYATKLGANALIVCPFAFTTDVDEVETAVRTVPQTAWELLGDGENCWGGYGGELTVDRYDVKLLQSAGQDRGVVIEYGKDLVSASIDTDIGGMYTGILPYYYYDDGETPERVVGDVQRISGFGFDRILPVDITEYCASLPTKEEVNRIGRQWMEENDIGKPNVNLRISYAQLNQTVRLHDTVTVRYPALGIDVKAKVTKTRFDVVRERYAAVDVGNVRSLGEDFYDASRLKKGLLPVERIADRSLTSAKYGTGSVGTSALMDWSVVRDKLKDGAVSDVKIASSSVSYQKLSQEMQVFFQDTIVANRIVSQHIDSSGGVTCSTIVVNSKQYMPGQISFVDGNGFTRTFYVLKLVEGT